MDKAQRDYLKRMFFFGFLLTSIVLILLIWTDQVTGIEAESPAYYRSTQPVEANILLTRTAEYQIHTLGTSTPKSEHKHQNQNGDQPDPAQPQTPSPTIDWDVREDDQ